jgi:hypothetical protein
MLTPNSNTFNIGKSNLTYSSFHHIYILNLKKLHPHLNVTLLNSQPHNNVKCTFYRMWNRFPELVIYMCPHSCFGNLVMAQACSFVGYLVLE